ncbi:YfiT family bacillithiol transferase [Solitalea koreensis]|uniref:DinB superfamily protein n=1 Tax=Solitalea koreensis TaxID=543615 RepID=A0A521EF32_9SPHI|nr:putative metal-dependent hydrolase [Solitalea koreensis]SMO82499.1 DinB superfamily protein [Solitalea koreensis]
MDQQSLQYPIGKFNAAENLSQGQIEDFISDIEQLPKQIAAAIAGLSAEKLDTPYRPGGWTVRQVMHHIPDSHMNAYIRFKLALTENNPTIRPYFEDRWAELPDSQLTPIDVSLTLLSSIHQRWVVLLKAMKADDFKRSYFHPEYQQAIALLHALQMYSWHGKHHLAHIMLVTNSH